jgi:anti-sigma-K factor RskA
MSDELNVLAGAYALNALDDEERAAFEAHLETCEECAEEVRGMQAAAFELSRTTEVAPPPQLRADILASINQIRPLAPITDNVIALRRARNSRSAWQVMAAACALIAIVAAGWGFSQHRSGRTSVAQNSAVEQVLQASDLKANTTAFEQGSGTVVYSNSEHKFVLIGHGIPALTSDKTYQLWLLPPNGSAVSVSTFVPDSSGNVSLPASADLSGIPKLGISVEPSGGSKTPTAGTVQTMNV